MPSFSAEAGKDGVFRLDEEAVWFGTPCILTKVAKSKFLG